MELTTSWEEKGIEKGRREGRQEGQQEGLQQLILRQLRRRFGSLAPEIEPRICQLPVEKLEVLGEALLDFASAADLGAWLASN